MRGVRLVGSLIWYCLGVYLLCTGVALTISASVGAAPWDIFHIGLSLHLPFSLGRTIQLVGAAVVGLDLLLRIRPGIGMVLIILISGPLIEYQLGWIRPPTVPVVQWLTLCAGILVSGLGVSVYTSAGLGPGPRDGLMIALTRLTGWPIAIVRNSMDAAVTLTGFLMGGPLGLGTLVVVLAYGPAVQLGMGLMRRLARLPGLSSVVHPVDLRKRRIQPHGAAD